MTAFASTAPAEHQAPPNGCLIATRHARTRDSLKTDEPEFPNVQLEIRTPVEPTAFPSDGRNYLIYELHLDNYSSSPLLLRGIEVISADSADKRLVAEANDKELDALLRPIGIDDMPDHHHLGAGQSIVAFMCIAFDAKTPVPDKLTHRILLDGSVANGPVIGTHHTSLHVLAPPVEGSDWTADDGPSIDSHHRTGLWVAGGLAQISRRYAIDWLKVKQGSMFSGDARDVHSYYGVR